MVAAGVTLTLACIVTPWTIRNHRVIGGFPFIRDNFGLELQMSRSDSASADMQRNMQRNMHVTMRAHHFLNKSEASKMASMGERAYYAEQERTAKTWIRENPMRFTKLTVERVYLFFEPVNGRRFHPLFYYLVPPLALFGLLLLLRHDVVVAAMLCCGLFAYALPHFLVQSSPRYSYPVLRILTTLARDGTIRLFDVLRARSKRPDTQTMAAA